MLARKNCQLWLASAFSSSLDFKPISKPNWSARAGDSYGTVGKCIGNGIIWVWIGAHEDYNKRF